MRNIEQGTFIQYMMSRKHISTSSLARSTQTTPTAISLVVWDQRKSKRLHRAIARELGFKDWASLKHAEEAFSKSANKTLKQVSKQLDKAM